MNKEDILKILEGAKDKNGDVPMRLVRQAFKKLPEPCTDTISRHAAIEAINHICPVDTEYDCTLLDRVDVRYVLSDLSSARPELCEDAVSRKAVYEAMVEKGQRSRRYKLGETWELNGAEIRETLDTVPSVTPKRKTGKWVNNIHDLPVCDQCGYMTPYDRAIDDYEYGNYCPNCGARMEEVNNE